MKLLLIGVTEPLVTALRAALSHRHDVHLLDGDPLDRAQCAAVARCDVVIHGFSDPGDPITRIEDATRGTWNILTTTRARRYIQLSSMRLFQTYDPGWHLDEQWPPRPSADPEILAPYLAEIAAREITRVRPIESLVLRLPDVVSAIMFSAGPIQPSWLHIDDAVAAIARAVESPMPGEPPARWQAVNIVRGDPSSRYPLGRAAAAPFSFVARHLDTDGVPINTEPPAFPVRPQELAGLPLPGSIALFGAGGPVAAAAARQLRRSHRLRLTDIRPLRDFATKTPQMVGQPPIPSVAPPHEERVVDITDPAAVTSAANGMDCLINCSVVRDDPVRSFRVNVIGALNTMRAAVDNGIRRVVHTGPALTLGPYPIGYADDRGVGSGVPPRPGDTLYDLTKYLGQEVCRVFAEQYAIACPVLLFVGFVSPGHSLSGPAHPFSVSWDDAGRAIAAAALISALPEPCPVIHVLADAPHDRYRNDAARTTLGFSPQDRLDRYWHRRF